MQRRNSPIKNDDVINQLATLRYKQLHSKSIAKADEDGQLQSVLHKDKQGQNTGERTCPKCSYQGKMNQQMKMGCVSWSWVVCLLLFTFFMCFIPVFVKSCKDKVLYCPSCGEIIDREFANCL